MSKFSIVIPALNEEKYLPNLLTSLTKQTRRDYEVVVVDGSSKDNTAALARSFGDSLPKLQVCVSAKASLPLQRNLGARASLENGWRLLTRTAHSFRILLNALIVSSQSGILSCLRHGSDPTAKRPGMQCSRC